MLLFCYPQTYYRTECYCLLHTDPLPDCTLLFCYPKTHYQTVYYCSATHRPNTRLYITIRQPKDPFYQTEYYCSATHRPITRMNATVLLHIDPLPDCTLLFCYPQTHYQTVYYCSATHRPITRLDTTVLLHTGPLPDCILLYPQELDVIIFLFFLGLALLRFCKNRRTDTVQLLK